MHRLQRKLEANPEYQEASKTRLKNIATKKIKTSFIGALAQFEESFGFLFGAKDPTPEQAKVKEALARLGFDEAYWRNQWELARNNTLNQGNNQIRALEKEFETYTVSWNRYHVNIPVVGGQNGQQG